MMKHHLFRIAVVLVFVSVLLSGCSSPNDGDINLLPTPTGESYPGPSDENAYPAPDDQMQTVFPKNISPSSNSVGVIRGNLILPADSAPGVFPGVYLGLILTDANGNAVITSLDRTTAPKAAFDSQGNFVFQDVAVGNYTLLIDLVDSMMILKENDGEGKILEIKGGEVIDVGEIVVTK